MPDLYSMWLGFAQQRNIESHALQMRRRRRQRSGRFAGSSLKKQLEKAYQMPLQKVLEELDEKVFRLEETFRTPVQEFSEKPDDGEGELQEKAGDKSNELSLRKISAVKKALKTVVDTLNKTLSYRFRKFYLITMPQLQSALTDLSLYARYLYKQIEIYQFSKNCDQKVLVRFTDNGVNNLIKKYNSNIERNLPAAQESPPEPTGNPGS